MALPDTNTLDIPSRGLPAEYVYSTTSGPVVDTGTLDTVSRGLPASYIYVTTAGGGTVTDTITADAVIQKSNSDTLTTDSTILKSESGSFSADAIIEKTSGEKTLTADATVEAARTDSITADSVVQASSGTKTLTADGTITKVIGASITADADIISVQAQEGSFTADASIQAAQSTTITADATVGRIGRCVWVSPANGADMGTLPVLVFVMPDAIGNMHFHLQLDTADTFDTGNLREFWTHRNQTGWEYYDGDSWEAFPAAGVPNTYSGNQARYTVQTELTLTTWYRRVRGGA